MNERDEKDKQEHKEWFKKEYQFEIWEPVFIESQKSWLESRRTLRDVLAKDQGRSDGGHIEGCRHSKERMEKWIQEGACPLCLTATGGTLRDLHEKDLETIKKMKGEMEKLHRRFREEIDYRIDQNGELQKENQRLQVRISELEKQLKEGRG